MIDDEGDEIPAEPPQQRLPVFRELTPGGDLHLLWWVALVLSFIAAGALGKAMAWYVFLAVAAVVGLRYLLVIVTRRVAFARFRSFPSQIGFPVTGWSDVLEEKLAKRWERWRLACEIGIELEPGTEAAAIAAAEQTFMDAARRCFYVPGSISGASNDPRELWTAKDHQLAGSANLLVVGEMYRFVLALDRIHRQGGKIRGVSLRSGGSLIGVSFRHRMHPGA